MPGIEQEEAPPPPPRQRPPVATEALRDRIVEKVKENRVTLIVGDTGCGNDLPALPSIRARSGLDRSLALGDSIRFFLVCRIWGLGGGLSPSPQLFLFLCSRKPRVSLAWIFAIFHLLLRFHLHFPFRKMYFFFHLLLFLRGSTEGGTIAVSPGGVSARLGRPARALARFNFDWKPQGSLSAYGLPLVFFKGLSLLGQFLFREFLPESSF
jgi:hypothetical protein